MRYILIFLVSTLLTSCTVSSKEPNFEAQEKNSTEFCKKVYSELDSYNKGVNTVYACKFGNDTCYIYSGYEKGGINCIREGSL